MFMNNNHDPTSDSPLKSDLNETHTDVFNFPNYISVVEN